MITTTDDPTADPIMSAGDCACLDSEGEWEGGKGEGGKGGR